MVYVLKIEYEKWWWKVAKKKYFWNPFVCQAFFGKSFLLHRKEDFANKLQKWPSLHIVYVHIIFIWNFKPKITPKFHFEHVNEGWISGVLGVKVQLFWGGLKNAFGIYFVKVKTMRKNAQIFVAFSKKLNFNAKYVNTLCTATSELQTTIWAV